MEAIRLFEMEHLDLSFVPRGRLKALARHATTALVQHLRHLAQDRRIATLLAFTYTYLAVVHDDAFDLFDVLMRTTFSAATREGQQERLRTIHDLDAAAQILAQACQIVLDETQDPDDAARAHLHLCPGRALASSRHDGWRTDAPTR